MMWGFASGIRRRRNHGNGTPRRVHEVGAQESRPLRTRIENGRRHAEHWKGAAQIEVRG